MNFNFSSFLNGSLKILNIANKTLPLIKEASPTIKNIKNTYNKFIGKNIINNKINYYQKNNNIIKNNNINPVNNINYPTFFH